ncbi:MAG: hypothetical protein KKA81_17535 [Bacteroidetes bacterium]|nr:hypothetical protein [Bacteroidota bacterium]
MKEWINGNEVSISVDNNACEGFRAEVVIFTKEITDIMDTSGTIVLGSSFNPTYMAELILEANKIATKKKGIIKPFKARFLMNGESLEDE